MLQHIHTLYSIHYTSKLNVLFVLSAPIFHAFLCRIQFKFPYKFQLILRFLLLFHSFRFMCAIVHHLWQSIINVQIELKWIQEHINVEPMNIDHCLSIEIQIFDSSLIEHWLKQTKERQQQKRNKSSAYISISTELN